jgi:hypothetical protein
MEYSSRNLGFTFLRARMRTKLLPAVAALGVGISLTILPLNAQESITSAADGRPLVTIKELMEKTITPATNTLWNAFEPPTTDEQWTALEEAAITLLVAANVTALGGTGPMDSEWIKEPAWKAFNQVMINAGHDALQAIRARDHDALLAAGDVLYPPCEGCHLQFNPGVANPQQ